ETYVEVAHEVIFRRWDKLREWIAAEREFLAWRSGLEAARRAWARAADRDKNDALLMGFALTQAQTWFPNRAKDLPGPDREFIVQSIAQKKARARRVRTLVYLLLAGMILGLGWINQSTLAGKWRWWTVTRPYMISQVRPYVLSVPKEQALKAG